MDRFPELRALEAIAQEGVYRVPPAVEGAVGAEDGAGADGDQAGIDEGGVEVYEDAFANAKEIGSKHMPWAGLGGDGMSDLP